MTRVFSLCLTAALAFCLPMQVQAQAKPAKKATTKGGVPKKIYCWEEKGTRVCGDSLPVSAVNNARTEISGKTGLATKHIERTLTEEERAAVEAAAQAEAQRQAAELARQQQEQKLVLSYADEASLNRAYDEKEAVIKNTISDIQKGIDSIRTVLVAKLQLAAAQQINKKAVSNTNAKSIQDLHVQIRNQEAIQARNRQAIATLKQERAASLATFRSVLQSVATPASVNAALGTQSQSPTPPPATQ